MSEPVLLFPFLDVAMRAVAVLILCALPLLLMPTPQESQRRKPKLSPSKAGMSEALTSD